MHICYGSQVLAATRTALGGFNSDLNKRNNEKKKKKEKDKTVSHDVFEKRRSRERKERKKK